jgi:hypothetical protein
LTDHPTFSPTYAPTVPVVEVEVVRKPTPPTVIALILIITIYAFSILFSTCYLKQSRNAMERDRDMARSLQSTTIEPI